MRDQHYRRITTRMSLRSSGLRKRVIPKSVVAVFGQDHAQEKGSGTPADAFVVCPYASGVRDAPRKRRLAPPSACGRARLPAFHYGSHQRDFRPEGSASGQASRKRRESCGVPHAPSRSQRCTSRAGRNAGRHDARAARVRSVSFRPRAPHSLRPQGVPSPKTSF
jgi:hypothetical protein